jgi:hypothetical protein
MDREITVVEFVDLLRRSTLAERRPDDDENCMKAILQHANSAFSAPRDGTACAAEMERKEKSSLHFFGIACAPIPITSLFRYCLRADPSCMLIIEFKLASTLMAFTKQWLSQRILEMHLPKCVKLPRD